MRTMRASEAKTHLSRLLDEVERGETIVITRHGRTIARIVPDISERQKRAAGAVARIRAARRTRPAITAAELLSARDEGRKR